MTLSPRQRDILENIESLFQDQDPDLASHLSDPNARPNGGLAMTVQGILPILPLAVDRLMLLGSSHESRTGRDWRSRGSPWSVAAPPAPVHAHALDPVDGCGDKRRAS